MARKKRVPVILFLLMSVTGTGIMLYPTVSDRINSRRQTRAIAAYQTEVSETSDEKIEELLAAAECFNEALRSLNGRFADSEALKEEYYKTLRLNVSDVIAYVEIPKINVNLPVFHGSSESVLQAGVGHLEGTTLPIGGADTHAALSAHRGLPTAKLFTNLDKLEIGDIFTIKILNKTLYYEVDRIDVVLPEQVDLLSIEPGGDLVTLITCTPYAINTHRLLVRGRRTEDVELPAEPIPFGAPAYDGEKEPFKLVFESQILLASAALALVIKIILELRQKRLREVPLLKKTQRRSKLA